MKKLLPILLLLAGCRSSRVDSPCIDPADVCSWSIRTSSWTLNPKGVAYPPTDSPHGREIDIFVKRGTALQWFSPNGLRTLQVYLDSYNPETKWYSYVAFSWEGFLGFRIWVDLDKRTISLMDLNYQHEKDFLP